MEHEADRGVRKRLHVMRTNISITKQAQSGGRIRTHTQNSGVLLSAPFMCNCHFLEGGDLDRLFLLDRLFCFRLDFLR